MSRLVLTRHAATRARQRGVTHAMLEALLALADQEIPVGDGCTALRVSRGGLSDAGGLADRLGGLVVVIGADGACRTVLRDRGGRAGRRYRSH